jgi:hypothetical protein
MTGHPPCLWHLADGLILYCLNPLRDGEQYHFTDRDTAVMVEATSKSHERGFVPAKLAILPFAPAALTVDRQHILYVTDTTYEPLHDAVRQLLSGIVIAGPRAIPPSPDPKRN